MEKLLLGIDLGLRTIKAVILDQTGKLLDREEQTVQGQLWNSFQEIINRMVARFPNRSFYLAVTGNGQYGLQLSENFLPVNEITALAHGAFRLFPEAASVFDIGAENARWVRIKPAKDQPETPEILDFAFNERCAAGTGLFLEQQAHRLKLSLSEFSALAEKAKKGARLAGRCSVFAKSDMIHLQQKGTPVEEIAYGVCQALVRSVASSLLKGKPLPLPVVISGCTTRNPGLMRAFREVMEVNKLDLLYGEFSPFIPALGAALIGLKESRNRTAVPADRLLLEAKPRQQEFSSSLPSLGQMPPAESQEPVSVLKGKVRAYLGVDIGSVSTDLVLLDEENRVLTAVYLPTRGQPLEVLKEGFEEILSRCPDGLELLGIGTTGSGRYLAGKLLQADVIKNEITCQMRSTCFFFPEVDTIFEIGGQDSKYIQVQNKKVIDFNLNKICAAGTGSFLEEQAAQLGLRVEKDFARLASLSEKPYDLSSRCTVFMETELMQAAATNQPVPDLVAGLAYSIARNYLEKVVERRPVGEHIVFQGGVASNQAVVRAFSRLLGKEIKVHPYNRLSGAIGAALEAKEKVKKSGKKSLGTEEIKQKWLKPFELKSFECQHCANRCQVVRISSGSENVYFGDICERYTSQSAAELRVPSPFNPIQWRNNFTENLLQKNGAAEKQPVVGLPRTSVFQEFLPFWITFFQALGFQVKVSPETTAETLEAGVKLQSAETCLPVKIALGHIKWLQADKSVDLVFFPSHLDSHRQKNASYYFCPYTEHLPHMIPEALRQKLLTAPVYLEPDEEVQVENWKTLARVFKEPEEKIAAAWKKALEIQDEFRKNQEIMGRKILEESRKTGQPVWLIAGRPYLLYDHYLNLNFWSHLDKLGVTALPLDYLPLEEIKLEEKIISPGDVPPWRYPQHLLKAAIWARRQPSVFPVFLTNYGCGLDGFVVKQIKKQLGQHPHLFLEFDEHRGEAGLVTRLEAFADEIAQQPEVKEKVQFLVKAAEDPEERPVEELKKLPFVIPYFADHAFAFSGAMKSRGLQGEVLPPPDRHSLELGEKYSSGKECHAYSYLLGDLLSYILTRKPSSETVFFFPGARYSCLLQQYGPAMRNLLAELGYPHVLVLTPTLDYFWKLIEFEGLKTLWQGLVAIDSLIKLSCQIRPYEINKGETDLVLARALRQVEQALAENKLSQTLTEIRNKLASIRVQREKKPVVGIVGDIYTRQNHFANNQLFHRLEELGCEVWPSPFLVDEIDFTFSREFYEKLTEGNLAETIKLGGLNLIKEAKKRQVTGRLQLADLKIKEPGYEELVKSTITYLNYNNNQTLFLNLARMIDFARKGADGLINVICFNCMLGTASQAISQRIKKDFADIPLPTLIYGETASTSEEARLEAFVEQVKARFKAQKQASVFT
jgi:predicted CoA-substrate-specific enzyme activase